jgi:hypothetical protein
MTARLTDLRAALDGGHDFAAACRQRAAACTFPRATDGVIDAMRSSIRPRPGGLVASAG